MVQMQGMMGGQPMMGAQPRAIPLPACDQGAMGAVMMQAPMGYATGGMGPGYGFDMSKLVPVQVEGCEEALTEAQAVAIYLLRSRQTCNQTPMELAAAGRSMVVAVMFRVKAKTVRDIWARKCWAEGTQAYWTEHERLMHECDKEKAILSTDVSPHEVETPITPDTPNSVATVPPPLSSSGSFLTRNPSSGSVASVVAGPPTNPPSRQNSFARRRRHSTTSTGVENMEVPALFGGSKRNLMDMVVTEEKATAEPPQPRSKRRASFSGDIMPSELAALGESLCEDVNVSLAPPIQPSWAVHGSGFFAPLGEPVDRADSLDRSSSSSSKKSLLPPPTLQEDSTTTAVGSAAITDQLGDQMQEDETNEQTAMAVQPAAPVQAEPSVEQKHEAAQTSLPAEPAKSSPASAPVVNADDEMRLRLCSAESDGSRFSSLASRIPSTFSEINANAAAYDFSRLRDASAGWSRSESQGLGRVKSDWLRSLSSGEVAELPLHLGSHPGGTTSSALMAQLDDLLTSTNEIHVVPEGEFEPSETFSEGSDAPSMEDVGAAEI